MDVGDSDDSKVLIHSKFWKARRGASQGGSQLTLTPPDLRNPDSSKESTSAKLPPPSFMTSTIHLPRIEQGQRIDHPFHSRSPRRALTSASSTSSQHDSGPGGSSTAGSAELGTTLASSAPHFQSEVFRFDSTDRERYLCSAISEEEEVFSPSPYESSQIFLDSPAIRISRLHLKGDSPPTSPPAVAEMENQNHLMARLHTGIAMLPTAGLDQSQSLFGIPSSPISPLTPNTPLSPSPLFSEHMFQQGFLAELYRRRCHSDSDLPLTPESCRNEPTDLSVKSLKTKTRVRARKSIPHPLTIPTKGGSLESDQSSPQDSPLDLSVRGNLDRFGSSTSCESLSSRFLSSLAVPNSSAGFSPGPLIRGEATSPTTRNVALRYNLDVSPVVEQMPTGSDASFVFVCPMCGQSFSLHDRLAKHMASRHKSKPHDPSKSYPCDVCHRSFARSDMLTRHMRLHTGVKPYTCRVCGQVFSRSDHLSTHQRTHTGEKPYKCPQCPYSACRRDMITRHLRTHSRSSSSSSEIQTPTSSCFPASDSVPSSMEMEDFPIKMEPLHPSRPPSSSSSIAPDSPIPLSPALNLGSLSVDSPTSPSRKEEPRPFITSQ